MSHATVVIEPKRSVFDLGLKEVWTHREILYFLVWGDLRVKYKQTALGFAWAIFQPLMACLIFSLVFSRTMRAATGGMPYPVFAYAALVPWQFFATSISKSSASLIAGQQLVKKVYFPRVILPLASVCSALIDLFPALLVMGGLMLYYGIPPRVTMLILPALLAMVLLIALAFSILFSGLCLKYRDVRFAVPFLTQIWMFATPVIYPSSLVTGAWKEWYALNPMAGVTDGFRWAILGTDFTIGSGFYAGLGIAVVSLLAGLMYFRTIEPEFADIV